MDPTVYLAITAGIFLIGLLMGSAIGQYMQACREHDALRAHRAEAIQLYKEIMGYYQAEFERTRSQ